MPNLSKASRVRIAVGGAVVSVMVAGAGTFGVLGAAATPLLGHAKHGADDPAGDNRGGHGTDDPAGHAKHGADDPAGDNRGAPDDPAGHA